MSEKPSNKELEQQIVELKKQNEILRSRTLYLSEEQKREYNKEYREQNKDYLKEQNKEYRTNNIVKLKEYQKEYSINNKDKINDYQAEYYKNNKDKLLVQQTEYNIKNKDRIKANANEVIVCECGCMITRSVLARHKKTKKHINLMSV